MLSAHSGERNAMQTAFGLRAVDNPMLDIKVDVFSRSIPLEMLHTMVLGPIKYLLQIRMPTLSKVQKEEVLASILYVGNVCHYYQSFVGRDFKAWAQMAVFILSSYLDDAQKKVLLSLSKVFCIAYCNYFTEELSTEWEGICVLTAKRCLPELLMKPKVHLLHLVSCMKDFGPSSAFDSVQKDVYPLMQASGHRMSTAINFAPSHDISRHFSVQQRIRHICDIGSTREGVMCGKGLQSLYSSPVVKHYFNNIT